MKFANQLLVTTSALTALVLAPTPANALFDQPAYVPPDPTPPQGMLNVLVIVLDDVGTDQLKMYGSDVGPAYACPSIQVMTTPTPALDALRNTGIMYTRAYVNPLCSPTRASLLTGRYGWRTGVGSAIDRGTTAYTLPNQEMFVTELIRDYNSRPYARGAFGKWHLAEIAARDAHPAENGFQTFQGNKGNLDDHYTWRKIVATGGALGGTATSTASTVGPNGAAPSTDSWVASVTRRDAAAWINAQTGPFFSYVCFNPPHAPFQVPPTTNLSTKTRSKLAALGYDPGERAAVNRVDQSIVYQSQLEAVDHEIYELLAAIAPKLNNTMILVIGDNGTPSETVIDASMAGRVKRSVYEYGDRVPMLVSGPLTWLHSGDTCRNLVSTVDLFRMIANFTGLKEPRIQEAIDATGLPNDSISAYYTVRNPNAAPRRTVAYSELFGNQAPPIPTNVTWLRSTTDGTYRYVRRRLSGVNLEELFDLRTDPCSRFDLRAPPNVLNPEQQAAFNALSAAMTAIAPS